MAAASGKRRAFGAELLDLPVDVAVGGEVFREAVQVGRLWTLGNLCVRTAEIDTGGPLVAERPGA